MDDPPSPPKKSQFSADLSKLDIDPNVILADAGYRKHLQRHAIKLVHTLCVNWALAVTP